MALQEKTYTLEEFWRIVALPENEDRRLELEDGVIVDMGSSSRLNTITAMRIAYFLNAYVIPQRAGYITGPDGGFQLGSRHVRRPDVGFIAQSHQISLQGVEFDVAPDLAVEVVSPDEDVFKKANEYLNAGTQIVWAVYALEQKVYVFHPATDGEMRVQIFTVNDILDGEHVLPGFTLSVRDLFPE